MIELIDEKLLSFSRPDQPVASERRWALYYVPRGDIWNEKTSFIHFPSTGETQRQSSFEKLWAACFMETSITLLFNFGKNDPNSVQDYKKLKIYSIYSSAYQHLTWLLRFEIYRLLKHKNR
jgi:hypothetical protein